MNNNLVQDLQFAISKVRKPYDKIIFFCVGTDRCIGDSYGPLVGHMLKQKINSPYIEVYGTLHNPIHAKNLEERINSIDTKNNFVIAIDACLTKYKDKIGNIFIENKTLNPGAGVGKDLPKIGDISIKCTVNTLDSFRFRALENTRLSLVYDLAVETVNAILEAINKNNIKEAACM